MSYSHHVNYSSNFDLGTRKGKAKAAEKSLRFPDAMYGMADSEETGLPTIEKYYVYVAHKTYIFPTSHFK